MRSRRRSLLPVLAVAIPAFTWGCWWIPLRYLEERGLAANWSPLLLYGLSALVALPLILRRAGPWRRRAAGIAAISFFYGSQLALLSCAVLYGEVVRVTLLFYLAPVWGSLLAVGVLREPFTTLRALAVALGLAGAAAVLGLEGGIPVPRTWPEWLGLLAGAQFALGALSSRMWPAVTGLESTFGTLACAALLAGVFLLIVPAATPAAGQFVAVLPVLLALAVLFVLPSYCFVFWGAARLDPGRVATLAMFEVIGATVTAAILTDEPFALPELSGCLLILGAGLVNGLDQMRPAGGDRQRTG